MHPELNPSKLSTLRPLALRKEAQIVADGSAPVEAVSGAFYKLLSMWRRDSNPRWAARNLLPVIYALLDPGRLPDPDAATASVVHLRLGGFAGAMGLLSCSEAPSAVIGELWPRAWAWVQFIEAIDCAPEDSGYSRRQLLAYLQPWLKHPVTAELTYATADVRIFAVHGWFSLVSHCELDDQAMLEPECQGTMGVLHKILGDCHRFPHHLQELVEGAGGIDNLASLTARYVALLVRSLTGSDEESLLQALFIVHQFIVNAGSNGELRPFWRSLGSAGLCRILTYTLILFADHSSTSAVQAVITMSVQLLIFVIQTFENLVEALHADLLRAIIMCSAFHGQRGVVAAALEQLLRTRLIGATLYYPFVITLASTLPKALAIENTSGFMDSPCWETWKFFIVLAKERLQFLEQFESKFRRTGACDNFECDVLVTRKTDLRCCGACRVFHYCSVECQMRSWGTHGHRIVCVHAQENPFAYGVGDRANRFYFFAILRDYQTRKSTVLLQKLAYIHRTGNSNFCVVMEYIEGRCAPRVAPLDEWRHIFDTHPYFEHIAIGCNEPHVIRFVDEVADCLDFCKILRCNTSAVVDGLVRIARQIPAKADVAQLGKLYPALYEEVQALARLEVVETYC